MENFRLIIICISLFLIIVPIFVIGYKKLIPS